MLTTALLLLLPFAMPALVLASAALHLAALALVLAAGWKGVDAVLALRRALRALVFTLRPSRARPSRTARSA